MFFIVQNILKSSEPFKHISNCGEYLQEVIVLCYNNFIQYKFE